MDRGVGHRRIKLDGTRQIRRRPSDTSNGLPVGVVEDLGGELSAVLMRSNRSELNVERSPIVRLALSDEIAL